MCKFRFFRFFQFFCFFCFAFIRHKHHRCMTSTKNIPSIFCVVSIHDFKTRTQVRIPCCNHQKCTTVRFIMPLSFNPHTCKLVIESGLFRDLFVHGSTSKHGLHPVYFRCNNYMCIIIRFMLWSVHGLHVFSWLQNMRLSLYICCNFCMCLYMTTKHGFVSA